MSSLLECRHIHVNIDRPADWVYDFAFNPSNMPSWASGLGDKIEKQNGDWIAHSPMGVVKLYFTPRNPYGILDHDVTLPDGDTVHNPLRIIPNGKGSTAIFTLFRQPDMSDQKFEDDADWVLKDLKKLKEILESQ